MWAQTDDALNNRISAALGGHDLSWDDRDLIQQGYAAAGGYGAKWSDLAPGVRAKIEEVEALPATSWEDPDDAPDDLD